MGATSPGQVGRSPEHPECPTRRSEAVARAPLCVSVEMVVVCVSVQVCVRRSGMQESKFD